MVLSLVISASTYMYSFSGVYCKDCGSEGNCWQGNGLDEGYQSCEVTYDENGNAIDCEVDTNGWGGCQRYVGPIIY